MAKKVGFRSNNSDDLYAYFEDDSGKSIAVGTDFGDNSNFKIVMGTIPEVTPSDSPAQLIIDSTANGDITINPNGLGDLIVSSLSTGVVQSDSIGTLSASNGTNGQLLIAATAGVPTWNNLTPGGGISITNGAHSITVTSTGGGLPWTKVVASSQVMVSNNGYIEAYGVAPCAFALPATAVVGDVLSITGTTAQGFYISGVSGDTITWVGQIIICPGNTLISTQQWTTITLLCVDSPGAGIHEWNVLSATGNYNLI
jgi:hypothetical protein